MVDQEGGSDALDGRVVDDQVASRSGSVVDGDDGLTRAREVYAAVGGESAFYAGGRRAISQVDDDPIAIGDAAAMRRSSGQQGEQCAIVQRLMASWPCRATTECLASSEALQTAVEAQMAAEALAVQTVIEQLAESTANASASALTLAYYLQLSYGPSAVSEVRDLPVKTTDDGRLELLRVLEIVLSASAAAVAEAKIVGYAAAVGKLSYSDTTEAKMHIDRAVRLRQTAELAKRAAARRVVGAAVCIQAAARVRPARRLRAYACLATLAVTVVRRRGAAVRLQSVARGLAARGQAEGLRAWARRVVISVVSGVDQVVAEARVADVEAADERAEAAVELEMASQHVGAVRLRGGGGEEDSGWEDSGGEEHSGWEDSEVSEEGGEMHESAAAYMERYRREVLEPRRAARKVARIERREAQIERMIDAAEAMVRRREVVAAAQDARAAKRARRVAVLRAVQERKAAKAARAGAVPVERWMVVAVITFAMMTAAVCVVAMILAARRGTGQLRSCRRGGGRQRSRRRRMWRRRACGLAAVT
jgi:hypothetical protein